MTNENTQTEFNIDNLLDGTLDDLPDMPEFKPFPAGTHRVSCQIVDKTQKAQQINGHPAYELKMTLIETVEQANPEEVPCQPKDQCSILFMLDNELGLGALKNIFKAAAETFGAKTNRELIADIQGAEAVVVVKQRQNKEKTQTYVQIVEIAFA